jgi:hypothetical protein
MEQGNRFYNNNRFYLEPDGISHEDGSHIRLGDSLQNMTLLHHYTVNLFMVDKFG